ncbi:hypothetical protein GCM10027040_29410 [Halomonas shantousis]
MALSEQAKSVQGLYLSMLGRAADPSGYDYWTNELQNSNIDNLIASFSSSEEFQEYTGGLSAEETVQAMYQSLFDREADTGGREYWTGRLESGEITIGQLATTMMDSASEKDQEALNAKLAISDYYTENVTQEEFDPDKELTYQNLHSNEELYAELQRLNEDYDTLNLEQVGSSIGGNPLYTAVVGNGPQTLMLVTQQHGGEPLGTEAALQLLEYLAGDSAEAQALRDEVTLVVMPRVNPDGFARWQEQAAGGQDILDPRLNEAEVDLNRTYDPEADYSEVQAPESDAVKQVIARYQPDLMVDYHNQNNYRNDDGSLDTTSVLWATNEDASTEVMEAGMRAAVAISSALEDYEHDQLTIYPGSDNPAIGRNGLGIEGTPTLLIEQRGLQEMDQVAQGLEIDYSALASALTLEGIIGLTGIIDAMASGTFDDLNPLLALEIPARSEGIDYADVYTDDQFEPVLGVQPGEFILT